MTKQKSFNLMKWLSILCLIVVIVMNMLSWIQIRGTSEAKEMLFGEVDELLETVPEDELEQTQDMLDDMGSKLDVEKFVDSLEGMFEPLRDLNLSPMDMLPIYVNFSYIIDFMTSPDMAVIMYSEMDEEAMLGINIIRAVFLIGLIFTAVVVLVSVLYIILHICNIRSLGIPIPILVLLHIIYMAILLVVMNILMMEMFYGVVSVKLSFAPFISLTCAILATIFWGLARGEKKKPVQAVSMQPQVEPQIQPQTQPQMESQPVVKYCRYCGTQQRQETKFCTNCGAALE